MKTGSKKQAFILSVVAIGALAFVVIELVPTGKGKGLISLVTGSPAPAASKLAAIDLPLDLQTDAFSNARLAVNVANKEKKATGEQPAAKSPVGKGFGPLGLRALPKPDLNAFDRAEMQKDSGIPADAFADPTTVPEAGNAARDPKENTGKGQQLKQDPNALTVSAIVRAEHSVAFISMGSKEALPFRQGDEIVKGVKLGTVSTDYVEVIVKGKSQRVAVGGTVRQ